MAFATTAGLGLVAALAIIIIIKTVYGLVKGTGKALLSFIAVIIAAAITFFVALPVSDAVAKLDISFLGYKAPEGEGSTVEDAVVHFVELLETEQGPMGKDIMQNGFLSSAVRKSPAFAASLIVIISLILRIVLIFIADPILRAVMKNNGGKPSATSRMIGATIGLVCAFVFFGITFMTPLGLISLAHDPAEKTDVIKNDYEQIENNFVVKTFSGMGFDKLGLAFIRGASEFSGKSGGGTVKAYYTDELNELGELYVLMIDTNVLKQENGEFSIDGNNILTNRKFIVGAAEISKRSYVIKEMLPILMKYAAIGTAQSAIGLPRDIGTITSEEIDKLVDVYEKMNDSGVIEKISEGNVLELLSDEESMRELIDTAKGSSIVSAIVENTAKQAIDDIIITLANSNEAETIDVDLLASLITKDDIAELMEQPQARMILLIISNDELDSFVAKYDDDPDLITQDDIKRVLESVMDQYGIEMEDLKNLYESQKNG